MTHKSASLFLFPGTVMLFEAGLLAFLLPAPSHSLKQWRLPVINKDLQLRVQPRY